MNISVKAKLDEMGVNLTTVATGSAAAFMRGISGIAREAHGEWIRLAQHRLQTSRQIYIQGLQQATSYKETVTSSRLQCEIQLVGEMPNNFEFGMASFDMKEIRPGWLGSAKAKTAKDGHKYMVIPFRHSQTSNASLGYSGQAKAENLRENLRTTIRQYGLDRLVTTATGQIATGPVARVPNNAMDVHRFLRGLTKIQTVASGPERTQVYSQLMTWRVMSENSPADSWHHPGLTGVHLMDEVGQYIDQKLEELIRLMISGGLF